ncbi:hypothetical protein KSF81_00005, partial [Siccirubricoccus sp. G192]|nr:hypothetical protein [Siccirubricoccus sp. G192]
MPVALTGRWMRSAWPIGRAAPRRWFMETGGWAAALRRWHGGSPASSRHAMCRVRAKLEPTAPGSDLLRDQACASAEAAR